MPELTDLLPLPAALRPLAVTLAAVPNPTGGLPLSYKVPAVGAAVPADGGLLATSGAAQVTQPATPGQVGAALLAWLLTLPPASGPAPGWWNNAGTPTYS